ncbi:MAG: ATP-binding protein [Pseudomonadota bacterium]
MDGIWYWDLERLENKWISPEFWELIGYDPAHRMHVRGAWKDVIFPEDLDAMLKKFEALRSGPDTPYDQLVRYRHANGSTVWVRCRGLAIRDGNGAPIRMLGTHIDVTPLKQAEETARAAQGVATNANEELKAFAYSTSHDLKSPANTIRMLLEEARRALNTGDLTDAKQMLDKAETTNNAMRGMVDKLLDYTRTVGTTTVPDPIDLDLLLVDVVQDLAADISRSGAKLHVDTLGIAKGIDWQLRKLFQNLISNAIKFQTKGNTPRIEIRTAPSKPGVLTIEVEDNGIGIAEEDQKRIFDLFSTLNRPSLYQGSGVGLAFCARVAHTHGSRLSVKSDLGAGTMFSFQLPS